MTKLDSENSAGRSVERVFLVLEKLTRNQSPMTLTELSNGLDLPKSSMLKLLHRMTSLGYLSEDPITRTYFPSPKICNLGRTADLLHLSLHKTRMMLTDLRDATGESVSLAIRHGVMAEYHGSLPGFHDLTFNLSDGLRYPLYIAAAGRVILSDMTDEEVEGLSDRIAKAQSPEWTPFRLPTLLQELSQIREQGFATTEPLSAQNVMSIAKILPMKAGKQRVSLSIGGVKDRVIANQNESVAQMDRVIAQYFP